MDKKMTKDKTKDTSQVVETDKIEQLEHLDQSEQSIEQLEQALEQARNREQRAVADYHNLMRRTQEERSKWARLATQEFVEDLLEPLSHLQLATTQLKDPGLEMVVNRLWQTLETHGLKKIDVLGKHFDIKTMEAVEQQGESDKGEIENDVVIQVVKEGYQLNGEVIQHAKVIIGNPVDQVAER
jgi:molecular chaperone GrpE